MAETPKKHLLLGDQEVADTNLSFAGTRKKQRPPADELDRSEKLSADAD